MRRLEIRSLFLALPLVLLLALALPRVGAAAGLLLADGGFGGALEIEEHRVRVTLANGIAVTEVEQVFRNLERRQVEALYVFPVPEKASVANFSMWIGGKEMVGEVVEKERARQIYESYKQVRKDPGLLEQVDYKSFEMRIFPIAPEAQQRVRLTYYQELDFDDSWATYVYPLATVARPGVDARVTGRFSFDLDVRSEIPILDLASPSHGGEMVMARHGDHYTQASLEAAGGSLARDVVIAYQILRPRTGLDLVASRPAARRGEDGYFLLTLTAGEELAGEAEGADYVFILDVSGSMAEDGKLALSRESVSAFIDELDPSDRFEVVSFNVAAAALFDGLRAADNAARAEAFEFLVDRRARGGTVLGPALDAAYRYKDPDRRLHVVVLSDGMTEQRERRVVMERIRSRPAGVRVFAIGVGNEVDRPLLTRLADKAGGLAAFVSRGDDFERQARAFRRKLRHPVAENLEITLEGGEVYDVTPAELPNLFHGAPVRLYGRYRKPGEVAVRIAATVGGEIFEREVTLELPETDDDHPEIERMWAWQRIDELGRQAGPGPLPGRVREEIVNLGETYSIVTEHTSFLVLENDAEYQRWRIERRNAQRLGRDRARRERLREELARLRDETSTGLGPVQVEKKSQKVAQAPRRKLDLPVGSPAPQPRPQSADVDLGGGAFGPGVLALALAAALAARGARRRKGGRR